MSAALPRVASSLDNLSFDRTGTQLRASVVVPTYKRAGLLDRCLTALAGQDFDKRDYEIVVADDAASPDTRRQVERWSAGTAQLGLVVRYVPVRGVHGPAAARNAGWQAARGEIIAFTDDDCIPVPGWLTVGLRPFEEGADGVMGSIKAPLGHSNTPTDYELNAIGLEGGEFLTANCFYTRRILKEIGGFDHRFPIAFREDTDVWLALLERNARLAVARDAEVIHPIRPGKWGISLSQQRRSMYNMLLYKKHPEMYIARVAPGPPWRYYRIVGTLFAALVGVLHGRWWLTFAAMAAWTYMTGRFTMQRLERTSRAPGHVLEMAITSALIPPLSLFWRLYGAIKYKVRFL